MIHKSAYVSEKAKLHETVKVGPGAVVLGEVDIDAGTVLGANAIIGHENANIKIGKDNKIFPHAFVGGEPQDLTYNQEVSNLIIGNKNTFREFSTVNTGTKKENNTTAIGNECLLMAYVHIGHDSEISNNVVVANTTNFAGHVKIGNHVTIGGACNFSQFIRVGDGCYVTGESAVNKDVIPYTIAQGKYALSRATNKICLLYTSPSPRDATLSRMPSSA